MPQRTGPERYPPTYKMRLDPSGMLRESCSATVSGLHPVSALVGDLDPVSTRWRGRRQMVDAIDLGFGGRWEEERSRLAINSQFFRDSRLSQTMWRVAWLESFLM